MSEELVDKITVTIGQNMHELAVTEYWDKNNDYAYLEPHKQLELLDSVLLTAQRDGAQFVLLPEFFLPRQYVFSHIKERAIRYKCIIMGGLEYGCLPFASPSGNKRLKNEAFIVIPDNLYSQSVAHSGQATVITIPKLNPAPEEDKKLLENGYEFANGNRLYHFSSRKFGNFAVLICFDFLNLPVQAILQSEIQTLFVLTYNKDVDGFISIADTVQRMLLSNVVICNTGFYGGSVAFTPLRDPRQRRKVVEIIGNNTQAAVSIQLPIKDIAAVQATGVTKQGNQTYFQRPPDFGRLGLRNL